MGTYRIRKYGEPILRQRCRKVENIDSEEREILERMAETMYKFDGIGLAAPQVGIARQLIVVDVGGGLIELVNPLILVREGESILEEGCLSLPEITVRVKRAERIVVEGWSEDRKRIIVQGEGLLAHALQHEIDHLSGILITDYANTMERSSFEGKLRELEKKSQKYLEKVSKM